MAKILLLSHEDDIFSILDTAEYLKNNNHEVLVIESSVSYATTFSYKFEACRRAYNIEIHGLKEPINLFESHILEKKIPENTNLELKKIEKDYLDDLKSFREIIRSDPASFNDHHTRKPYYNIKSERIRNYYYLVISNWFINKIKKFKPDISFCFLGNYFLKDLTARISEKFAFGHFILTTSRLNINMAILDYKYLTIKNPYLESRRKDLINNEVKRILKDTKEVSDSHTYKFNNYKEDCFNDHRLRQKKQLNIVKSKLKYLERMIKISIINKFKNSNYSQSKLRFFNSNFIYSLIYEFKSLIKTIIIFNRYEKIYNSEKFIINQKNKGFKFILFTLHLLPESSTLTFSKCHHEEDIIKYISTRLPVDYFLLVKENKEMIGERSSNFYKKLNELGNVILLDPYLPPSNTLKLANAVVTLSGTVMIEAILFGIKRLAIFGLPEYRELIPNYYREYNGINNMLHEIKNEITPKDSSLTIQQYLEKILSWGVQWDVKKQLYIKYGVGRNIRNLKYDCETGSEIGKLITNKLLEI